MNYKEEITKLLSLILTELPEEEIFQHIEIPDADKGDFAFPCFRLSKLLKKSPNIIATQTLEKLQKPTWLTEVKVLGAYINFYIDKTVFAKQVITNVLNDKENYGKTNIGKKEKIVIDYSSPNIAKPFHIGHLRSTCIGHSLYNIFNYMGYESVGINHLGDWGTQFGKLIVAYKLWGDNSLIEKNGINELTRIYVKFHDEAKKDDSLNEQARQWLMKMQTDDEEALRLWSWFKDISIVEFNKVYDILGIKFDSWNGESFYTDKMDEVVEELKTKNIMKQSNGAMVVDLEQYNMPPCLILRSDGGTLYPTRDIAAAIYRKKTYDFNKCIILTGLDQNLHFAQWFKVIELMGRDWAKDLVHVSFGLVSFEEGKLSTRSGNVVLIEDLLQQSIQKTREIIENKNPNLENKEEVSNQVGIGAIVFNNLYNQRIKDVTFNFNKILSFEGETGPYVQYTHARACSILHKCKNIPIYKNEIDFSLVSDNYSVEVIKCIDQYSNKIVEAGTKYEPYILSRYLIDLAQKFNKFYNENIILHEDENVKLARLSIVTCVQIILKSGLNLLGIKSPKQM